MKSNKVIFRLIKTLNNFLTKLIKMTTEITI